MHRFHTTQNLRTGERIALPREVARQCFRVLKLRAGERIGLFDGSGLEATMALVEVSSETVEGIIESRSYPPVEPHLKLELAAALPRQEKWEWILQKGTELGVSGFQPLRTARCVARVAAADWPKKAERWQKIIIEAVEQSGRTRVPELLAPMTLQGLLRSSPCGIVLHTGENLPRLRECLLHPPDDSETGTLRLLTGPEGGLENGEVQTLQDAGWKAATLGPRTLRCETAVLAACAIVMES